MKRVRNSLALLAAGMLAALAAGAPAGPAPVFVPLAHSALVTVNAATEAGALMLRVQRTRDQAPLPGAQLQVTLDGHNLPVTPRPDGTWEAPLGSLASSAEGTLDITVAHDGVREILSGRLPGVAAAAGSRGAVSSTASGAVARLQAHKQLAWWILNIAVVLIGVIAVSRRMS
jgi:hypothetical protein